MIVDVPTFEDFMENLQYDVKNLADKRIFFRLTDVDKDLEGEDRDIFMSLTCLVGGDSYKYILQFNRHLGMDSDFGADATLENSQKRDLYMAQLEDYAVSENISLLPGKLEQF